MTGTDPTFVRFGSRGSVNVVKNVPSGDSPLYLIHETHQIFKNDFILRHEKPTDPDDPLSDQNIKDRYYGTKDPVADKLLNRAKALPALQPPEDKTITTLYVGNLGDPGEITESDLRYNIHIVKNLDYNFRASKLLIFQKLFLPIWRTAQRCPGPE